MLYLDYDDILRYETNSNSDSSVDGMYTFVITAKGKMLVSQNASHLQLCHSTDEKLFITGGELYKHHNQVYFNLCSDLFEAVNDVNVVSHMEQLFETIMTCSEFLQEFHH